MNVDYRIERTRNRHSRAVIADDTIVIRLARNLSAWEESKHVENLVRRMTKMLLKERERIRVNPYVPLEDGQEDAVADLVHRINADTFNFRIGNVRLKPMTTQWGSCSSYGHINLNTALLQLPHHLLEYVIIHELAHRKVKNHSRTFWDLVESVYPNLKEARREMRKYRIGR